MKAVLKILFPICLVAFMWFGCKPDSSPRGKIHVPSLELEVADVTESDDQQAIFVSLRYVVAEGQIVFDSYPNHHCYEISVNNADFQDVGKGHYVHGPFEKSYIKTLTVEHPCMTPVVYYKLGDITFADIKTIKIRMAYGGEANIKTVYPGESVDITVWTGQIVSQEYMVKESHNKPNAGDGK